MTQPSPILTLYTADSVRVVHRLHYDWIGWLASADAAGRGSGRTQVPEPEPDFPVAEDWRGTGAPVATPDLGPTGASPVATGAATDLASVGHRLSAAIAACRPLWAVDGLALDTWRLVGDRIQVLFTTEPHVSPVLCTQRVKGRLDHALRSAVVTPVPPAVSADPGSTGASPLVTDAAATDLASVVLADPPATADLASVERRLSTAIAFRRTVGFRSLGENTRDVVANYLARQVTKSDFVDPRFKEFLHRFTSTDPAVDLAQPFPGGHGRYWYNLHLVLVVADRRFPMTLDSTFAKVHDACGQLAAADGHALARVSVMPDHVHLALRGNITRSPLEIGLLFLNGLAAAVGFNQRCWSAEFYTGTFSEYGLDKIPGRRPDACPPRGSTPCRHDSFRRPRSAHGLGVHV